MSRTEIDRKYGQIVEFAGVERFLDTPVKRYSSGMYTRLAFSIAAHLEPDILIVDEVLAVGDAAFQKKCLGKMQTVSREGRTVLFVSHNLGAVRALCDRGIVLQHGVVTVDAPVAKAVAAYLATLEDASAYDVAERTDRHGKGDVRLTRIEVTSDDDARGTLTTGRPARFRFHVSDVLSGMSCAFDVFDPLGQQITYFNSSLSEIAGSAPGHAGWAQRVRFVDRETQPARPCRGPRLARPRQLQKPRPEVRRFLGPAASRRRSRSRARLAGADVHAIRQRRLAAPLDDAGVTGLPK